MCPLTSDYTQLYVAPFPGISIEVLIDTFSICNTTYYAKFCTNLSKQLPHWRHISWEEVVVLSFFQLIDSSWDFLFHIASVQCLIQWVGVGGHSGMTCLCHLTQQLQWVCCSFCDGCVHSGVEYTFSSGFTTANTALCYSCSFEMSTSLISILTVV